MFKLFKKKEGSVKSTELPPLPDELPEMDVMPALTQPMMQTPMNVPPGSIHDEIPNDPLLGTSNSNTLKYQAIISPQPNIDLPKIQQPSPEMFSDQIPRVEQPQLPPVPEIQKIQSVQTPVPELESEEIPKPPAIFSDSSFYETPEELQHLVEPHEKKDIDEDFEKKYGLSSTEIISTPEQQIQPEKPTSIQGPLFIDIESFKVMLKEVDTLKNNLVTSENIIAQLTDIKNAKDREIERWRTTLEDIQRKLNYVDKTLFNEA